MSLEWYEWECPYCRRTGEVNPAHDYESGMVMSTNCPHCNGEVILLCDYQPTFVAYRSENWRAES